MILIKDKDNQLVGNNLLIDVLGCFGVEETPKNGL